jgi:hypothetical protein
MVDLDIVDAASAQKYEVREGTKMVSYDFVLVSDQEAKALREHNAMQAMRKLGRSMKLWHGLPVCCLSPDLRPKFTN